jgi:hypothetical protein
VLREFLPSLIGAEPTDLIAQGERRYYRPRDQPFIYFILREADVRQGAIVLAQSALASSAIC